MSEDNDTTDNLFDSVQSGNEQTEDSGGSVFGDGDEPGEDDATAFDNSETIADATEDDSLFDDDGFGAVGDETTVTNEDVDSELPRIDLGVEGLDDMIRGGVPERHLITTIGGAGTGKTTFGIQFLHHGLQQGEQAVFLTLEQSREEILATASELGWPFERHEEENNLVVVDLDPVEMANSLENIRNELPRLISDFGADRLVLDSVSLLEMMYDDHARRRTKVYDFTRSLKEAGVTAFLTSEASEGNSYASRHGIIEYLTDAVFILRHVRGESREARLAVEIQKIRNAKHSREMKPYELTDEGISVYRQATLF
jgi:circadian clock protein KaiC